MTYVDAQRIKKKSGRELVALWALNSGRALSLKITELIAHHLGSKIGFVYIGGYPKSGTTWISQLVAHYLDLPFIRPFSAMPLTFKCVVHHHWNYHPSLDRSIYVIRDGRDVMVSSYMAAMRVYQARGQAIHSLERKAIRNLVGNFGNYSHVYRRLNHLFGAGFDPWNVERNLPIFIEGEMSKPIRWSVHQGWPAHVSSWRIRSVNTTFVKYEDMLQDSIAELSKALMELVESDINEREVRLTVDRYSFERKTGRVPGTEDRMSFARKGVKGDWQNHFSQEARQVFDHYAGDLLVELGYETDRTWVNATSERS